MLWVTFCILNILERPFSIALPLSTISLYVCFLSLGSARGILNWDVEDGVFLFVAFLNKFCDVCGIMNVITSTDFSQEGASNS